MTIIELLEHVGVDDIMVQMLKSNCTGAKVRKSGEVEVSFMTAETSVAEVCGLTNPPKKVGLVVWLPYDKLPESMKK